MNDYKFPALQVLLLINCWSGRWRVEIHVGHDATQHLLRQGADPFLGLAQFDKTGVLLKRLGLASELYGLGFRS